MRATAERMTLAETVWPAQDGQTLARGVILAVVGSMILTLSAKVNVPFYPVPLSMQTFAVLVIGAAYGWKLAVATVLLYLAEGALGLPVFANTPERGVGLVYMFGPTGGYLIGFVVAAGLIGWLCERGWDRTFLWLLAAMLLGHVIILAYGMTWLASQIGFEKAWAFGIAPFYLATVLKTLLGAAFIKGAWTFAERRG
jgi:biotin transport system substrate-specific component